MVKGTALRQHLPPLLPLAAYAALMVARVPALIWPGRFWAEEGSVYFAEAYAHPIPDMLFAPQLGYYSLLNKLAALLAVHVVALEYAPVVTGLVAVAMQLLPALLLLYSRIPGFESLRLKAAALLAMLVVQPNQEVWVNSTNSQFFLCLAGAVILVSEPGRGRMRVLRLSALAVGSLTGMATALLLPLFAAQYVRERSRVRLEELLVLAGGCLVQGIAMATSGLRPGMPLLDLLPAVLVNKQWVLPFAGARFCEQAAVPLARLCLSAPLWPWLLAVAVYALVLVPMIARRRREAVLLVAASVLLVTVSFLRSAEAASRETAIRHLQALGGGRYYFAPNVMLVLALLIPAPAGRPAARWVRLHRAGELVLVVLALALGSLDFAGGRSAHQWAFQGPRWSSEVRKFREQGGRELAIWPVSRTVVLRPGRAGSAPGQR